MSRRTHHCLACQGRTRHDDHVCAACRRRGVTRDGDQLRVPVVVRLPRVVKDPARPTLAELEDSIDLGRYVRSFTTSVLGGGRR